MYAVIGASYGDEGKGLVTDYLSDRSTLVVRFNGGAQAGHTVVTPEGQRHVFHHFGSGTFRGAATCLSEHFICHPREFGRELVALRSLGYSPKVFVSPDARVTTPYDVMINQALEEARGLGRHGSCGLGINETVVRCETEHELTVGDLLDSESRQRLEGIRTEYVRWRCAQLNLPVPAAAALDGLVDAFLDEAGHFLRHVVVLETRDVLRTYRDHLLFEGAQGLRLDEKGHDFPYVTRSRTGMHNVLALLEQARLTNDPLHAIYVSRCYVTRHGAGPLPGEVDGHPFGWVGPETNVENLHQGKFRYGLLDLNHLYDYINRDVTEAFASPVRVEQWLALTCLDQAPGDVDVTGVTLAPQVPLALRSHGPTRATVTSLMESCA